MPRWEYRSEVVTHGLMGRHRDEIDLERVMEAMNAVGNEGWELVSVLRDQQFHGAKDGHLLLFKRPRPD